MAKRDNFTATTKTQLAHRAAHFCSNPRCLKLTVGPSSVPNKALTTGHAAHIHAASKLGPRYNESQTTEERTSIENGIWLCRECGVIVDCDESGHTANQLKKWKTDHEIMISEVHTEGYSRSLNLLQSGRMEPQIAKEIIASMEDRRSLWVTFDAEFPDRVRQSLDKLRSRFIITPAHFVILRWPRSFHPIGVSWSALTTQIDARVLNHADVDPTSLLSNLFTLHAPARGHFSLNSLFTAIPPSRQ